MIEPHDSRGSETRHPTPPAPVRPHCVSCGADRTGPYCSQCGEKARAESDLDWRQFLFHEVPHELWQADGKLPRTLRSLLTRPGELAVAFVQGNRKPFVGPLRLYLVIFVLFAISGTLSSADEQRLPQLAAQLDGTHWLERLLHHGQSFDWSDARVQRQFADRAKWFGELGTFVIYLFVALLQSALFAKLRRRYVEHLALALNVSSFFLLIYTAANLCVHWFDREHVLENIGQVQTVLALTALPLYWYLGIRRFYHIDRRWAASAAIVVTLGNALIATALNTVIVGILIAFA